MRLFQNGDTLIAWLRRSSFSKQLASVLEWPRERVLEQASTLAQACHASILLVAYPPPPLLEQDVRAREEMLETGFLTQQAEQLRSSTGLTVQTAFTEGDPAAFIERLFDQDRQSLLIVTSRQQAEHRVISFLHQSNLPVLFVGI